MKQIGDVRTLNVFMQRGLEGIQLKHRAGLQVTATKLSSPKAHILATQLLHHRNTHQNSVETNTVWHKRVTESQI